MPVFVLNPDLPILILKSVDYFAFKTDGLLDWHFNQTGDNLLEYSQGSCLIPERVKIAWSFMRIGIQSVGYLRNSCPVMTDSQRSELVELVLMQ